MPLFTVLACLGSPVVAPEASWIDERVAAIVRAHPDLVSATTLGTSTGGRPLHLITVAGTGASAPTEPASVMLVAGIDARHRVGVEAALGVIEKLAADKPEWLKTHALYVVPCLNPDGFSGKGPKADFGRLPMSDDADRDGRKDEDPGEDLNGDGMITMMRVKDPGVGSELRATMVDDPDFPGLMKAPDASKGERAVYAVLSEGIDNDEDGEFNEDGPGGTAGGGVDLDMNFPAQWPEFKDGAGRRPVQTSETETLIKWMQAHTEIAVVLVYGRHDNLVNLPRVGEMDASREVPLGIENDDKTLYEEVGKKFKEITGQTEAPKMDWAGSFTSWSYSQLGVPTFETPMWVRPEVKGEPRKKEPEKKPEPAPAPKPPEGPTEEEIKQRIAEYEAADDAKKEELMIEFRKLPQELQDRIMSIAQGHGDPAAKPHEPAPKPEEPKPAQEGKKEAKTDDQKWMRYFESRPQMPGFVPWKEFRHPQLGVVEIGGFVPGARMNPPPDELPGLIEKQVKFMGEVAGRLPKVELSTAVQRVGPGLWRVSARLTNTGQMATLPAIGVKAKRTTPTLISLDLPATRIVNGEKIRRSWSIAPGQSFDGDWTVSAADGSKIRLRVSSPLFAAKETEVELREEQK